MMSLAAPPPTKKRKRKKTENSVCNKKVLKSSFCKLGDDQKEALEPARGGLQDVHVAFYSVDEVTFPDKKGRKIEKVWRDLKPGNRGMLHTCRSYMKKVKEDMAYSRYASHHDHLKHTTNHSSYHCSPKLKKKNLIDLLPSSEFHSVRKRTPLLCKVEHIRTGAGLNSRNLHVSEPKLGAAGNRRSHLAVPVSVGASHRRTFPVDSQSLKRTTTESELFSVCGVERMHFNKWMHNLEVRRKIPKAYVRNKYREHFLRDEMPDIYALHLLADTALNLGPEPIFHIQVQNKEQQSRQGRNDHEPLSSNNNSLASKFNAERNVGQGSISEASFVMQKDLLSDEVDIDVHVFPEVNLLTCTSIDDKQNFNQEMKNNDKALISKDNDIGNSRMTGFHVIKESQEVAINADGKAGGAENECFDCHNSMCTQPPTSKGFQTTKSITDLTYLPCVPSRNDSFLPEHKERIDETIVERDDIDFKSVSPYPRELYSMFVSVVSVYHDKFSSAWHELESCSYRENSQPTLLTCLETPQKSEGYPISSTKNFFDRSLEDSLNSKKCCSSFRATHFRNQSPGNRVREIVQSSKQKATIMVDAAIKVMPSTKVGKDAYAMIGESLDSAGVQQVGVNFRISKLQYCSYLHNGGPRNCHQNLLCNPAEVASIVNSINSTVPTFALNDSQILPKLSSACVAALLMIQACSDKGLPPAESMEILEHAARDLHPQYSQNLHIYREIEELMSIIKTQVLSLVRTPGSNLQM